MSWEKKTRADFQHEATRVEQDRRGKQILAVVVVVALSLLGMVFYLDVRKPKLDENFCPKDGLISETVVLLDRTDPLTSTQKEFVLKRLRLLGDKDLEDFERLSLYGLSEDRSSWNAAPMFSICNPGNKGNEAIETLRRKMDRYRRFFQEPLENVLNQLLADSTSKTSPIMEMIESISRRPELSGQAQRRRLIIVSDMMQNAPGYTQYKLPINYDTYSQGPYAKQQQVSLHGARVEIIYLEREPLKMYQTPNHISFWERWFSSNDARLISVTPVR